MWESHSLEPICDQPQALLETFDGACSIKRNPRLSKALLKFLNNLLMTLYYRQTSSSHSEDMYHTYSFKKTNRWTAIPNLIRTLLQIPGDEVVQQAARGKQRTAVVSNL